MLACSLPKVTFLLPPVTGRTAGCSRSPAPARRPARRPLRQWRRHPPRRRTWLALPSVALVGALGLTRTFYNKLFNIL